MVFGRPQRLIKLTRLESLQFHGHLGGLVGSGLLDPVQKICSGGCDNNVKVWKLNNGVWEMDSPALQMHTDWVRHVAWAPNLGLLKSTIASALQDWRAIIWTAARDGDSGKGRFGRYLGR